MDWQERMTRAIDCLEEGLYGEADLEKAAAAANCSVFHFYRMFEVIAGVGPAEYLRRRRLSEAAMLLSSGGEEKVLDLALRYGYDSPDSFARAFRREFGCLPSEARRKGVILHSYPRLFFSVVLKGDKAMEYRIEELPAFELAGVSVEVGTKGGENFTAVPAFWATVMKDGRFEQLCAKADMARLGVCGVCHTFNMATGSFKYSIAVDAPASMDAPAGMDGMPAGSERFTVPASTWGKFTSRGPMKPNYQDMIKRIFSEWMPASEWEHSGSAEIEYYPDVGFGPESPDYWCEYWVPLKKGKKA
jgi:AraC family transcriptional regulator